MHDAQTNRDVAHYIEATVEAVLAGDLATARKILSLINRDRLILERLHTKSLVRDRIREIRTKSRLPLRRVARMRVPDLLKRDTFGKDHYVCRYSHCGKRTIDLRVLKFLARLFPEELAYHPNWHPVEDHIIQWTNSASIEHRVSFPYGGTSLPENLITACYQCNDAKNLYLAEDLGWIVANRPQSEWDGLTRYLSDLREAVSANGVLTDTRETKYGADKAVVPAGLREGMLIRAVLPGGSQARRYKVEIADGDRAVVYEIWKSIKQGVWAQSKKPRIILQSEVQAIVAEATPSPGSLIDSATNHK